MALEVWGKTEKMTALTIAATGHVLGTATRLAAGDAPAEAASLAGSAMPVGFGLTLAADRLGVETVAFNKEALRSPRDYVVQKGALVMLSAGVTPALSSVDRTLTLDLGSTFTKDTNYVVRVESGDDAPEMAPFEEARTAEATTPPVSQVVVTLDRSLSSTKTYRVLAAVAGRALFVGELTAT
jgi:hypothetical protein